MLRGMGKTKRFKEIDIHVYFGKKTTVEVARDRKRHYLNVTDASMHRLARLVNFFSSVDTPVKPDFAAGFDGWSVTLSEGFYYLVEIKTLEGNTADRIKVYSRTNLYGGTNHTKDKYDGFVEWCKTKNVPTKDYTYTQY